MSDSSQETEELIHKQGRDERRRQQSQEKRGQPTQGGEAAVTLVPATAPATLPAGNWSSRKCQLIGLRDRGTCAGLQPDQPAHHSLSSCTPRSGGHTPSSPNSPRSKTSGKRTVGRNVCSNCRFAAENSSDLETYFLPCVQPMWAQSCGWQPVAEARSLGFSTLNSINPRMCARGSWRWTCSEHHSSRLVAVGE